MTDLPDKYPDFRQVDVRNSEAALRHLILLLEEFKKLVVEAVNSKTDAP